MLYRLLLAVLVLGLSAPLSHAEEFPSREVRIFVPYPAGGGVDVVTRTLGEELSKLWSKPVVIENRPGAGGTIASRAVATSQPDGYTLIMVASGHATNPFMYPTLPYDTFKDFTPISLIGSSPNILLVKADSPFKSLADVLAQARAKPDTLNYGMAGVGTSTHLAGELLKSMAKIDIRVVAYRGGGPALNDLLGGHIPLSINNMPEAIGQVASGTVRALGVTTSTRSPFLPDVPTFAEAGVPGYDSAVWWALIGPGGMPREVVTKIASDCIAVLKTEAMRERLKKIGATPEGSSPEALDKLIRAEYEKWGPIIKAAGIKAE
ncbi:MAG: tripartite tricarboxylate transporter substrate binding protein [Hyphomicrobiales bacterium]|nr:MAG: tripartite tricarboxylate transporter substrate binding protein [Hyphomicrobiales bacterium]